MHFCTFVIIGNTLDPQHAVDTALAPFDEALKVAPYRDYYFDASQVEGIDLRCVRITAINLALRNLYGYVLWGDSLCNGVKRSFRTGFNGRGFIADIAPDAVPAPMQQVVAEPDPQFIVTPTDPRADLPTHQSQLRLF